jgi:hypothetical protein
VENEDNAGDDIDNIENSGDNGGEASEEKFDNVGDNEEEEQNNNINDLGDKSTDMGTEESIETETDTEAEINTETEADAETEADTKTEIETEASDNIVGEIIKDINACKMASELFELLKGNDYTDFINYIDTLTEDEYEAAIINFQQSIYDRITSEDFEWDDEEAKKYFVELYKLNLLDDENDELTNTASYEVTIPTDFTIIDSNEESANLLSIEATLNNFRDDEHLNIKVDSKNGFCLSNGSSSISYELYNSGIKLDNGDTFEIPKIDEKEYTKELKLIITGTPVYAGTYCDTLTFTVSMETQEQ